MITPFLVKHSIFRMRRMNVSLLLSVLGIAVGIFSIIAISGIMNGMQALLVEKLVLVETYDYKGYAKIDENISIEEITENLLQIEGVSYAVAFIDQFALLKADGRSEVVTIRAIDFNSFLRDEKLFETMKLYNNIYPQYAYETDNSSIVGKGIARRLQIRRNDLITVVFPSDAAGFVPIQLELQMTDRFSVAQKYNNNWIFLPLQHYFSQLEEPELTVAFGVRAKRSRSIKNNISTILSSVSTWEENNSSFHIALKTEKVMLFLMLVAIFGVIILHFRFSVLRRINRKKEEIVALRTIGATPFSIQKWFIGETLIIGISGCVLGSTLGLLFLYYFPFISTLLAEHFNLYIDIETSSIVVTSITDILYTGVFTLFLLALTSMSVIRGVNSITPLQVIHYE